MTKSGLTPGGICTNREAPAVEITKWLEWLNEEYGLENYEELTEFLQATEERLKKQRLGYIRAFVERVGLRVLTNDERPAEAMLAELQAIEEEATLNE